MNGEPENIAADIPEALISQLLEDIHRACGVRTTFSSISGEELAASSNIYPPVCEKSRISPENRDRCRGCAIRALEHAVQSDEVYFYRCWRGLMNATKPVYAGGQAIGALHIAGYISTPEHMESAALIDFAPGNSFTPEEEASIPFIYKERVQDTISIVSLAANYLSEAYLRQEAERMQAEANFLALQRQISPHFLFNALNSIGQLALLEGDEETPEAIYSLAALLRRSMRQESSEVSLLDEVSFVRDYVSFKQRLGRCPIRYREELSSGLENIHIPPLTIQPLVENSICHGLERKPGGGTVTLRITKENEFLNITVSDDGIGFDENVARNNIKGEASGIGFNNVMERLELNYPGAFRYAIRSVPGEGTSVTLYIPL